MSDMEILYTASDVYKRLEVKDSTLRKYVEVLQREGYTIKRNKQGRREYTKYDVIVLEKLVELSKYDGMSLEKAAKLIMQQFQNENTEQIDKEDIVPYNIQQQFQQQYSVMMEKLNQEQKKSILQMEKRLSEQIDRRNDQIEERLKQRDENLMKTFREIQETKKLMIEIAAAKEEKRAWWKFWK